MKAELPLFPEGTVTEKDLPELRRQIQAGRMVATTLDTPAKAFAAGYVSSQYKDAVAFLVILLVLFAMPRGLFGKATAERV